MIYVFIALDFHAKIGQKTANDNEHIRPFGLGETNGRGDILYSFICEESLYCLNTFYKKKHKANGLGSAPAKQLKVK